MSSPWEPGVAQGMQRHGGRHHSVQKTVAPAVVPEPAAAEQPMAVQDAPLAPVEAPEGSGE
jgi:hypothetical protein